MIRILLAAAMAIGLTACSSGGAAPPKPMRTVAATAPSTPTPPPMPAEAQANTKAGAIAFVRHYVDLLNFLQSTGNPTGLHAIESGACRSCTQVRVGISKIYNAGGHIIGGSWTESTAPAALKNGEGKWIVRIGFEHSVQSVIRRSGAPPKTVGRGSLVAAFYVSHLALGWRVDQWSRIV